MNIADILGLGPKPPPTIDAARVRTHLLGHDDDIPPKEKNMSRATDVADAIAKLGGRATRQDLQAATGLEGKQLENGLQLARTGGLITRDGKDYVLAKGAPATPSKKPATAKKKPATKAKKTAEPKAENKPRAGEPPEYNDVSRVSSVERITSPSTPCPADAEAYVLRDGSVLIIEDGMRIHLTESQYIAVLNTKE